MRIKITILAVVLSTILNAQAEAPGILWKKTVSPGTNVNLSYSGSSTQLSDGNFVFTGTVENTFIPQITKTNSTGTVLWQKNITDLADNMPFLVKKDNGNNIYFITEHRGNGNSSVVKMDIDGNVSWKKIITINNMETFLTDIDILPDGSIILSGDTESDTSASYFFAKYDSNGNQVWLKNKSVTQYPLSYINDTVLLSDGGFMLVGNIYLTETDEEGYPWIAKYDATRNLIWEKTYNSEGESYYYKALVNNAGEILVAGLSISANNSGNKAFLTKKDASGNYLWQNDYITQDFVEPEVIQAVDNGYLLPISAYNNGNYTNIIKKINESGATVWQQNYDNYLEQGVIFNSFIKTNDNNYFGLAQKSNNYLLYKFGGSLGVADVAKKSLSVYPNPAKDIINFSEEVSNIKIADFSGKIVKNIATEERTIDVSDLPKGIYVVTAITKDGKSINHKVIKE